MEKNSKIYVAGHRGLVGSAIVRNLKERGFTNLLVRTHKELDLKRQEDVKEFFEQEKPEYVFLAAAKVGGIHANSTYPAEFIYDNLMIESNIIHSSYKNKVKKLLFLGSSCIYPKFAEQPIKEEYLLTGELEETNEAYAIAKITGIELCKFYRRQYGCDFISAMPTNLYGINDNFDLIEYAYAIDNVDGKMQVELEEEIIRKKGSQYILVKCKDSSGNVSYSRTRLVIYDVFSLKNLYILFIVINILLIAIIYILRIKKRM